MSATTTIADAYGEGACLYETGKVPRPRHRGTGEQILEVPKDASASQLRKAYYKRCLLYHPDKLSSGLSDEDKVRVDWRAHRTVTHLHPQFAVASIAYTILSDDEKRREYDESGEVDDEDDLASKSGTEQWKNYFSNLFPKVTTKDIDAFEVKYKCSDEEEEDVLKYYSQFKGDLNKMVECVMLSSDIDKERWVADYIKPAIEEGSVGDYTERKPEPEVACDDTDDDDVPVAQIVDDDDDGEEEEMAHAEPVAKKAKGRKKSSSSSSSAEDSLIAQIRGRSGGGFASMMEGLEAKYGGGKKRKQKSAEPDIDDDEFNAIRAGLDKKRGASLGLAVQLSEPDILNDLQSLDLSSLLSLSAKLFSGAVLDDLKLRDLSGSPGCLAKLVDSVALALPWHGMSGERRGSGPLSSPKRLRKCTFRSTGERRRTDESGASSPHRNPRASCRSYPLRRRGRDEGDNRTAYVLRSFAVLAWPADRNRHA
ncbi:hypothetical protein THAOC_30668 [Thalassiosira oceanica]|uniref:J domain-containing protein n=1 Tax=Thalassiosira oceanica TaxID=159749 RepID=K0RN71_THAOC|nr:hypothetical protein THAOC_30668 [Thalassiosira oceanica]|eukprot:EJK50376.1 hypothetical protein THAOC_30668 [Thalassiosira oceanica]